MNPDLLTSVVNTAESQRDRWMRALQADYAKADDRSLPELLDFAVRFGRLINYYDLDDTIQGDWSDFFARDPILVLASIATTDVAAMERELARLAGRIRDERNEASKRQQLEQLFESALDLPRRIDRWVHAMDAREAGAATRRMHARIAADIRDHLGGQLRLLKAWDDARGQAQARDYSSFDLLWTLHTEVDQVVYSGNTENERIDRALPQIVGAWHPFSDSVARWAAAAPGEIAAALEEGDGRHQPHVALFVAFAHLLAAAQHSINDFSTRWADFYFRRVLLDANRERRPDSVYVAFEAEPGTAPVSVTVPRHTRLLAGKDAAGQERAYESDDDLTVTDTSLAMVRTVRTITGPLLPRVPGDVIERIVSRQLTREGATASGGFATFGHAADEAATIGLVVGAPALWLRGGIRTVTLQIGCAPSPPGVSGLLMRLSLATGLSADQILQTLLQHAFTLSVSTGSGWLPADTYAVDLVRGQGGPRFTLTFTLGADAPPVAPFPDSPLGTEHPAVRVELRQQRVALDEGRVPVGVYPLSILEGLAIVSVDVMVRVEALVPATVENPVGIVDTSRPFAPFWPVPAVGSYTRFREPELFVKDVSTLALRLAWFALPADETGFHGYYRGYVIGPNGVSRTRLFDNQVFRAAVIVERGVPARRQETRSEDYLFRTVSGSSASIPEARARLSKETVFANLPISAGDAAAGNAGAHGAVRVELTAPPYAFGDSLYATNVLHAATPSTRSGAACEMSCQEQYGFLLQAARSLETILPPLTQTGLRGRLVEATRAFRGLRTRAHTVGANKTVTLTRLADAAHESLAACLADWQARFAPQQLNALQAQLAACRVGPALERLSACELLRSHLRDRAAEAGADSASPHLTRCDLIVGAGWWVRDSEAGYSDRSEWGYRQTVRTNVTRCIRELRARYDTAVKTCIEQCQHGDQTLLRPNPPYLPQLEAVSFEYSAAGPATAFAHMLPFGGFRQLDMEGPERPALLPSFANAGNLYVGFTRLAAPQTLPLFLRMGQGHGVAPPAVSWAFLSGNRWLPIASPSRRADATGGLQTSGIIALTVPRADDPRPSSVMPGPFQWLRAAVTERPDDVPPVLGVYAHAVRATRQIAGDGGAGVEEPLPARTITALAKPLNGIADVVQPAPSSGGRAAESDREFRRRMSERLRHKNRAIVSWDYEHIVLERFPSIWQVRVLPARMPGAGDRSGGGGNVRVIVVPGPTSPDVSDPTAPTCSADTLAAIADALQNAAGPFVRVQVLNPTYVRTKLTATVEWRDGEDPRLSADRLSADIKAYLSPWDDSVRGERGISEAELAEFVQSRRYVQLVTALAFEYDPGARLASEPECCYLTTAAAHVVHDETAIAAPVQEGY